MRHGEVGSVLKVGVFRQQLESNQASTLATLGGAATATHQPNITLKLRKGRKQRRQELRKEVSRYPVRQVRSDDAVVQDRR